MLRRPFLSVSVALCVPAAFAQTYPPRNFMTNAGPYSATVTYAESDVVQSGNLFYVSLAAGNVGHPVTDTTHWQPLNNGSYTINGKTVTTGGAISLAPADIGADPAGAASAAQRTATQALGMAQTAKNAIANGVATTPSTLFPLCGAGTANQTQVCSKAPATAMALGADPTSFAPFNPVCDAVEKPVTITNNFGQYLYSTINSNSTDNTAALALAVGASNVTVSLGAATPIGASAEFEAHTTFRRVLAIPDGCNYRVSTWPALVGVDGLKIRGNRSSGYISSTSGNGPIFYSSNAGSTSGTNHDSIEEHRFVYVGGPPGTSTGNCAGFVGGGHNLMHGVHCFGFNLGIVNAGNEYSNFTDNESAWNNVGVASVPATFSSYNSQNQVVPSAIAGNGTPSVDNHFSGNIVRNNRVANYVFNGASTNTVRNGSATNGGMADVVFGAIDSPYVDTITLAGWAAAACPPNSTVQLVLAGGGYTLPAFAVMYTDARGHPTGVTLNGGATQEDSSGNLILPTLNGGKRYSSEPTVTAPACTTPPTSMTAHVQAWTGVLPFSGDASGDGVNLTGASQNIFEENDLENEGVLNTRLNRNQSGFQFLEDVSANTNTIQTNTVGLGIGGYAYQKVFRDEGIGNRHLSNNLPPLVDPITAATCSGIATQDGEVSALSGISDPENQICNADDTVNTASRFEGWDGAYKKLRGLSISANGATVQLTTTASTALGGVFGISNAPGAGYNSPAPTMTGSLYGVPETTGTFVSTNSNSPATTIFQGDGKAGSTQIGIAKIPNSPYYIAVNSILTGPGVPAGTRVLKNQGGKLTVSQALTATNNGATYTTYPVGQVGTLGIPSGSVCSYAYQFNGTGSDPTTWQYDVTAVCGNGGSFALYGSSGKIMGQERYGIPSLTVNLGATVATPYTGTCYAPHTEIINYNGSHSWCGHSGDQWKINVVAPK